LKIIINNQRFAFSGECNLNRFRYRLTIKYQQECVIVRIAEKRTFKANSRLCGLVGRELAPSVEDPGRVKSKTKKLAPVAFLLSVHDLKPKAGHLKIRLESGPVTADMTTTVVYNYKLLINDI